MKAGFVTPDGADALCYAKGMKIEEVLDFVKKQGLMQLATVNSEGKPEASVVEFGELADFTIVIDLLMDSRKYKNLQSNPNVAVVIGWDDSITVQLEGEAHELSGVELEAAKQAYFAKTPWSKKWESNPSIVYFAIKPHWVRYSDLNKTPWQIQEFNL